MGGAKTVVRKIQEKLYGFISVYNNEIED